LRKSSNIFLPLIEFGQICPNLASVATLSQFPLLPVFPASLSLASHFFTFNPRRS
jgi:hypothetical protein